MTATKKARRAGTAPKKKAGNQVGRTMRTPPHSRATALFPGVCGRCDEPFDAGTRIALYDNWGHVICPKPETTFTDQDFDRLPRSPLFDAFRQRMTM